ncbi:formin-like [Salvelinus fontinalis]|uniref:formin-like n=1 Tax=Salvelinus fontinalis TaxID=8038 RepID=UPI0024869C79|nr:formin-like [Salvelinus fontinalis]
MDEVNMNANGNSDAAQGKASSNSTIFTRSDRSESLRPDVETPVLKFFRTLSEETDTSPGNINRSHGTSVEVNGNEKTGGDSSAVGVVQKNGESTTPTTVVRANEREEVCGTEGCRELESVDWMPPGTSCSVDCDRNGGLAQWIPEAQSDIMDLEEKDANGRCLVQSKDYIADKKTHLQGNGGSTDQSDGCIPERTSHLQGYVGPMDSLKNELRVSIDKHRNSGASEDCSRKEPIDTYTQCATGSTNQDVATDCPSTDQSEIIDQQRLYRSTDKSHQDMLKSDEISNTDDKDTAKDVRNNTDESTDKHDILTWLTDSETNPASSNKQGTCTDDNQIQDLPTPDDDLTRDLANPSAVRAGKPQDLPTPDDDLTRDLANPSAVRAGKPQDLPTPDDDLTRDLANPSAVRAGKPQDLPTPDNDLTRDLANPSAVRAGKPQDLPTPDDDLTRDLANPSAVRAGKPDTSGTPSSNNRTVVLTMIRTEPVSEEQQHTFAETETVVGTTGQTEEPGCGSSIEVKVRGETYPHSDSDSLTEAVVERGETDTGNDRVVSCPSETMLSSEVIERAPAEAKSTAGLSHPTSPQGPTSTPGPTSGPPPGTTSIRATFSLSSPEEKPLQLPALFSGLRVLKKGAAGPDQDIVALIKPPSPSDLGVNKPVRREQKMVRRRQGTFLDQLSQFLNMEKDDNSNMKESAGEERRESTGEERRESTGEERRESTGEESKESTGEEKREKESTGEERKESEPSEESKEFSDEPEEGREVKEKTEKDTETEKTEKDTEKEKTEERSVIKPLESSEPSETLEPSEPKEPQKPPSSAEVAFDAFKAFFVPRPLRRDQDAVKRKAWIFERTFKTPEKKTDSKSRASTPGDGEDRSTPGRLQAIWPPTKEEKVGLKYTEAEHQAALLQLKRECNEEMEKIQEDFGKLLRQMRGDNEERVFHLECHLARLQSDLVLGAHHRRGDLRDVAVSTGDDLSPRTVHNVCVQTDRQTFIRTPEDEEGGVRLGLQPPLNVPKRLGLASISLNLSGQATSPSSPSSSPLLLPPPPPPPPPPFPKQTQGLDGPPPPPPPPPGCSPPPPPPPPGCVPPPGGLNYSVLVDKPHRKPAVEPACLMKPLYWTRIQIQDNKDTLWNSLVEPDIINTTEFEDLFSKTTLQTKKKPLSEAYEKKAKAKKVIKLLDGKRSQAVGILISSLHLEMNDIQQAVLTVDNSVVDLETIQALYENRAQPDELERIKRHYHTSEEELIKLLDKPEQFLYELSQIPDFPGRASCIIFQSFFIDAIASVQRKVDIVSHVCKDLLETSSVREVMGLVLALGNHMNGGNGTRGQADGFGLEILPKLKDVKSRDNRISLVDYVVSYYLRNLDENAGTERSVFPLPEPQDVFLAAQVKFEDITKELSQLRRDLTVCEKDVQKVCSSSPDEHLQPFKDKMEAFVLNAHKEQDEMHAQLMFAQKSFHELVTFLGLKPKTGETEVATGHFFMLWFEFCTDFMTRWRRENKNISKERLKEAQLSVKKITADKKVETRKINPNSLKERLRQKEANMVATS